jgi:outer membrane protein TolC
MPLLRYLCSFVLVLSFFPASLAAQGKRVLTLEESVALAFKQNPELAVAENEHTKTRAGIWQAWSTVLPRIDGFASLQHSWEIQTSRIPNFLKPMLGPLAGMIPGFEQMPDFVDIAFGLENMLRYGASITQPLFLGGAGMAGIRVANAAERVSEHALEAKRQTLIHDVATAFYAVLLAKELVRVQENALAQARANLEVVSKKFDVGMASPFDKMRAQVDAANIEPEAIAARNNLQSALSGLRTLMGLDRNSAIEVSGQLAFVEDELRTASLPDLQKTALERRHEVRIADEQATIADNGISLARSEYWPKLIFQTELSYLGMRDDLRFVGKDFSKGLTSALTLQIPIFTGFSRWKQNEKAQLDYDIALENQRRLLIGVDAEVEVAFNKFREAEEKYRSADQTVALGTEALRLARVLYDEGANTQLDVLNSQLALTRAQVNHANSLFEYQTARYQLRRALGMLEGVL